MKYPEESCDILLDPWLRGIKGPGVDEVEGWILRSGLDSAARGTPGSTSPGSAMEPTSLRVRRSFRGRERKFRRSSRNPMSLLC
jgi:hypothetical protein